MKQITKVPIPDKFLVELYKLKKDSKEVENRVNEAKWEEEKFKSRKMDFFCRLADEVPSLRHSVIQNPSGYGMELNENEKVLEVTKYDEMF